MPQALIACPIVLAVVLVVSGVAKLRDAAGVDAAFRTMRVPEALNRPGLRRAFPWAEIALGVLLVVAPWPLNILVAVGVLGLMAAYLALVAAAVRRPEPVDCHCFGALTEGRVTAWTVARNLTLVLVAVLAVADSVAGTPLVRLDAQSVAWLAAIALTAWLVLTILGGRPASPAAPEPAAPAASDTGEAGDLDYVRLPIPYGSLTGAEGPVTLRQLSRQRAVLLLWVSATCGSCAEVIAQIPAWRAELGPVDVRPVLASVDTLAERAPDLAPIALADPEHQVARLFDVWGVPMAVLLGADGRLAGGPVLGGPAVTDLVEQMRDQLADAEAPAAEPPPDSPDAAGAVAAGVAGGDAAPVR